MKIMVPSRSIQNVSEVFHSGAQYIFVNNRPIKYKELEKVRILISCFKINQNNYKIFTEHFQIVTKIILEALEQELSVRKKPIFILYILINAANVDINLEPNKNSALFKEQVFVCTK